MSYSLTAEQERWLTRCASQRGGYDIARHIRFRWEQGRMGQVDGRTPLPGLKRDLNRINRAISEGTYYPDPITAEQVQQAWDVDHDPDEGDWNIVYEHDQWWVVGYDSDDTRHVYSVVEVTGPTGPLGFEEV